VTVANIGNVPLSNVDVILTEVSQKFANKFFDKDSISLDPGEVKTLSFRWTARVSARSIRAEVEVNGTISVEEIDMDDNWMLEQVYVDPIDDSPVVITNNDDGIFTPETAAVGGLGLGILGAILVFFGSKDLVRYPFFLALGPLYSKLKPEHLLNNRLRKRIYVYVQNHPGEHFRSILTHLDLTNGTLAHHLYTLEKENLIRSQRDGLYRRFYPAGYQIDPGHITLTSIQQRIMDLVKEEPGHSQKEISQILEISNSTVNYNIKSMKEKGLIEMRKEGKNTRIFPSPDQNA
jgi:DNA-binding MarR family transcriptional regulator